MTRYETKFTPGPWQMHDSEYCLEEIWGALDLVDGGVQVCSVNDTIPAMRADNALKKARGE